MPAKSQSQRRLIFKKRDQYKNKENAPEKWKWVFDSEWENKGKLPEKISKIKKFKEYVNENYSYNESLYDDFLRLDPKIVKNNEYFIELVHEIETDFYENNEDLRKVFIIDGNSNYNINFSNITIGKRYNLSYVFGKYDPVHGSLTSGNRKESDKRIEIINIPFSFTFLKDELEKMFNTNRLKYPETTLKVTELKPNYNRNPNLGNHRISNEIEKVYKISSDLAEYLFSFFYNKYNEQYPELKKSNYRSERSIKDIKIGISPIIKHVNIKTKDGKNNTYGLRADVDLKKIKSIASQMTENEFSDFTQKQRSELYKPHDDYLKSKKNKIKNKINEILIKENIISEESVKYSYLSLGDSRFNYSNETSEDFSKKIKDIFKDIEIEGFKLVNVHVDKSDFSKKLVYFLRMDFELIEN